MGKESEEKTMLLGEYFLHIYMEETTSLFSGDGQGDIDVVIEVEAFGETKKTEKRENIVFGTSAFYGEHFFFDKKFNERQVLADETIKVRVYNSKILRSLIGSTEFSASSIYYEDEHAFRHRWFFLSNVQKDYQKIMGYVKISANFTRSDEKKALLAVETSEETMTGMSLKNLSIPPQFKLERKQIQVNIYHADRLFLMDNHWTQGKGSDPYVKLYLGESEIKTEYLSINGVSTPMYWKMYITLIYPTFIDQLTMCLKDHEKGLKSNEFFGSEKFSIEDIKSGKYSNPFWCYIYGGPEYYDNGDIKSKMDQFPEIASTFKGSLYMSMKMIDAVKNSNFREKMQRHEILEPPAKQPFLIKMEVYSVQNFHYQDNDDDDDHYVEINWGGQVAKTDKKEMKNNMFEYYQYIELMENFSCSTLEELPDIIVAVTKFKSSFKKLKRVSYCRLRPENYISKDKISDKYICLNIDKSVSDVADDAPGILHFKLGVNHQERWTPTEVGNFDVNYRKPKMIPIYLSVNLFQAKELPAGDEDGSGDPVAQVYHYGTTFRSSIFIDTLSPVWNEKIVLATYAVGHFIPPLIISVHDYDPKVTKKDATAEELRRGGKYEFLGNACIFVTKNNRIDHYRQTPEPKWHLLRYTKDSKMGKLSVSVGLCGRKEDKSHPPRSAIMKMPENIEKHLIKIRILGMRNLQSTGLIPIKKPYIRINTSSLILRAGSTEKVPYSILETIPKHGGRDPNIGEILNLEVDLPIEDSFKPSISCKVLDKALFGSEKTIGTFEIDIGRYSLLTKMSLFSRLNVLKKTLQEQNSRPDAIPILEEIMKELDNTIKQQGRRILSETKDAQKQIMSTIGKNVPLLGIDSVQNKLAEYMKEKPGSGSKHHNEQQYMGDDILTASNTQLSNILDFNESQTKKNVEFNASKYHNDSVDTDVMMKVRQENEILAPQQANYDHYQDNLFVIKPKYKRISSEEAQEDYNQNETEAEDEELANLKKSSASKFSLVEIDIPDQNKYRAIGYDSGRRKAKHYRLKLDGPLETSQYIGKSEFDSIEIVRGKRIKSDVSFIERVFGSKDQFKTVGLFKGGVSCISLKMLNALSKLNLETELDKMHIPYSKEAWENNQIDKDMLQKVKVMTRVYILEAQLYKSEDTYSKNDPYLKISLGDDVFNGREDALEDRDFAIFNQRVSFDHEFPGASVLKIEIVDRDIAFDDTIGETYIDLEERFYDDKFRAMPEQPIERRKLYTADSGQESGYVDLWVETFARRQKGDGIKEPEPILWDISSAPAKDFELRVIVWDVKNVPNDDPEDMSDIYVKVALNSLDPDLEGCTDTHIRAADGFGSFNWRFKFPIKINAYSSRPEEQGKYRIDFQVWDKDLASFDDYLSSRTLPFYHLIKEASESDSKAVMKMKKDGQTEFEFTVKTKPNEKLDNASLIKESKLRISVELVPKEFAEQNPVGGGRGPPNNSPFLPEPVGRFQFTMNPFKLIDRLVGPAFKKKCLLLSCCICYIVLIIILFPIILGNLITSIFI